MKRFFYLLAIALLLVACGNKGQQTKMIETEVPERPAGQSDVLQLTAPPMDTVRVGFIGLGMRGPGAVERFAQIEGTAVKGLCDVEADRVEACQELLEKLGRPRATGYSGSSEAYKEMCERDDIDLIYIATDWVHHVPLAVYAMEHGKHVAIEVPAALTMDEIWQLINTSERTRLHCMMLENCVYDFFEIATLNMAQQGLFGEVLHVEGSYLHNLDDFWTEYWENWRLDYNMKNRGDIYPTHGIGPDCQVLNIHRGDRMEYLVAMDTKPYNGPKVVKKLTGQDCPDFQNGDQTSTLIRTVNGKTMLIQHDVLTPRPYSRMYQVVGSDGYASKYPIQQLLFRTENLDSTTTADYQNLNAHSALPAELCQAMLQKYLPPFVQELEETARRVGGHGGMDFLMDYRLVYCLQNGLPLDMDVYDMAEWCCLGPLTRLSLENNSAPVAIPDFTRGAWNKVKGFSYAFAQNE
ncbi:MAG: Gfo/Idh/MocA family oxidoreductase [Bacteroidales bacterium]|nr:Gfo/Idh/MocA family oxidoreductase [Bacteroidales bacterium]